MKIEDYSSILFALLIDEINNTNNNLKNHVVEERLVIFAMS